MYIRTRLFDAIVKPVLLYGCEVWGPSVLRRGCLAGSKWIADVEKWHRAFLRSCLDVRRSTPDAALMLELRREPLALAVLKSVLGFARRVYERADTDVVKVAMKESFELQARGVTRCWAAHLLRCCAAHDMRAGCFEEVCDVERVEVVTVLTQLHATLVKGSVPGSVREVPDSDRVGFKVKKYLKWFYDKDAVVTDTFWYHLSRPKDIAAVARFRLGSHNLNVEAKRFIGAHQGRSQRVCECCCEEQVEDELHVLSCPQYHDLVISHGAVFDRVPPPGGEDSQVNFLMNRAAQPALFWRCFASFLHKMQRARARVFD